MLLVARVDALRAVAGVEVLVELEAGELLEDRDAVFLSGAGVYRGFIDDDVALLQDLANGLGGLDQRGEIGALVLVDRRWDGDDEDIAGGEVLRIGGIAQALRLAHLFVRDFERAVVTRAQCVDTRPVDVEAENVALLGEFDCEWQADVAKADDGELDFRESIHWEALSLWQ